MSATIGTSGTRLRISFSAIAASLSGTASLTISQPAVTISSICATVAPTSAVSVLVIDWMTQGAPPPICTCLTCTAFDFRILFGRRRRRRGRAISWCAPDRYLFQRIVSQHEYHQQDHQHKTYLLNPFAHSQ